MKVKIIIESQQLNKEELRQLIQAIRLCEKATFPDKEISIWVEVPELPTEECAEILAGIKPPYKYSPRIIKRDKQD